MMSNGSNAAFSIFQGKKKNTAIDKRTKNQNSGNNFILKKPCLYIIKILLG